MTYCNATMNLEEQRFLRYKGKIFVTITIVKAKEPLCIVASGVLVTGSSKLEGVLLLSILKTDPISYKTKCFREANLAFCNKNTHTNFTPTTYICGVSQYSHLACVCLLDLVVLRKASRVSIQ